MGGWSLGLCGMDWTQCLAKPKMENDYYIEAEKIEIDNCLIANEFKIVYSESGGWGPCSSFFFQTWQRTSHKNVFE